MPEQAPPTNKSNDAPQGPFSPSNLYIGGPYSAGYALSEEAAWQRRVSPSNRVTTTKLTAENPAVAAPDVAQIAAGLPNAIHAALQAANEQTPPTGPGASVYGGTAAVELQAAAHAVLHSETPTAPAAGSQPGAAPATQGPTAHEA